MATRYLNAKERGERRPGGCAERIRHEDSSSTTGAMHRAWINVKSAVTNRDRHAILAEAERGEDTAVAAYKDAMEKDLPAPIRDIVGRQSAEVKAAHDKVRNLRDAVAQK